MNGIEYVVYACILFILFALWRFAKQGRAVLAELRGTKGFSASQFYVGTDNASGIAYEETTGRFLIIVDRADQYLKAILNPQDIVSVELFEDGNSITKTMRRSQLSGAVIGGLLAGGIGAIIGGLSGKTKTEETINRIELRIVVADSQNPVCDIVFLWTKVPKGGLLYTMSSGKARHWHALLSMAIRATE